MEDYTFFEVSKDDFISNFFLLKLSNVVLTIARLALAKLERDMDDFFVFNYTQSECFDE
jgi:hypothetical protein